MKLPIVCPKCMQVDLQRTRPFSTVEFCDDGRYQVTCPHGHTTLTVLQQEKFEVLFEIGAWAILDGYYREAVSSFAASLERFLEYYVRAAVSQTGIDRSKADMAWKTVASQSERQLGAFTFVYLMAVGERPVMLSQKMVQFRNEVVHKGKIPTRQESVEYGQAVLDVVRPAMADAVARFPEGVTDAMFRQVDYGAAAADVEAVATMCVPTILSLTVGTPGHNSVPLDDALRTLKR